MAISSLEFFTCLDLVFSAGGLEKVADPVGLLAEFWPEVPARCSVLSDLGLSGSL